MTVRDSITRTGARTPGAEDYPTSMAAHGRAPIPTQCGITAVVSTCAKGRHKPNISRCMPGAGLSRSMRGKVLPYMPAFQPYRGKPAVRNDREGRGNVGIIRSPVRASILPDCGVEVPENLPYRDFKTWREHQILLSVLQRLCNVSEGSYHLTNTVEGTITERRDHH